MGTEQTTMTEQFKTLKHKTLPGTYGYFANSPIEVCHVSIPRLFGMRVSMESLREYYFDQPVLLQQLTDYELITVNVVLAPSAVDIAAGLFNIHRHDPCSAETIYHEDELLQLLKSWGLPAPDWEGNADRMEREMLSPPGDTIKETMEALGIDFPLFVIKMGISSQGAQDLLNGIAPITEPIARRLELTLNVDTQFWLNREANYRQKLATLQNKQP